MFTQDITLNTNQTYSLISQRTNSSVRGNASEEVSEPHTMTISHENAKSGRRSSVVIFEDVESVALAGAELPHSDSIKVMFKVQYNPFGGRLDNVADINARLTELIEFINTPANITKLLNQET